jgi:hypothetical protein
MIHGYSRSRESFAGALLKRGSQRGR